MQEMSLTVRLQWDIGIAKKLPHPWSFAPTHWLCNATLSRNSQPSSAFPTKAVAETSHLPQHSWIMIYSLGVTVHSLLLCPPPPTGYKAFCLHASTQPSSKVMEFLWLFLRHTFDTSWWLLWTKACFLLSLLIMVHVVWTSYVVLEPALQRVIGIAAQKGKMFHPQIASAMLFLASETPGLAQVIPFDCHFEVLLFTVSSSSCYRGYRGSCMVCSISFLNPEVTRHKQSIPTSSWWNWASRSGLTLSPCFSRAGNEKNKNCLWNAFLPLVGHRARLAPGEWSASAHMKALPSVGSCLCCLAYYCLS